MDMELVLLDKAKTEFYKNIIKSYSSDVELYEPTNSYHISWTLVCMSRDGFVPPNSYKSYYILHFQLELNP